MAVNFIFNIFIYIFVSKLQHKGKVYWTNVQILMNIFLLNFVNFNIHITLNV
nr:MAG TPA: hypothetical protein [Caudoviricetes sp.]